VDLALKTDNQPSSERSHSQLEALRLRNGIVDAIDTKFQKQVQDVKKRRSMSTVAGLRQSAHYQFADVVGIACRSGTVTLV
jgi:hypothetical protein